MKKFNLTNIKIYVSLAVIVTFFGCENDHINTNEIIEPPLGELITIDTYDGKQVTYRSIDGENIFEGDIILTEAQINFLKNGPENNNKTDNDYSISQKAAPGVFLNRWINSTVNFKISFTDARSDILSAINTLESRTNIDFVERASGNYIDFVFIDTDEYCGSSKLGMVGGRQEIKLNCTSQRTIIHEIVHALGFFHEHSRLDRDNHININWSNIESKFRHNFDKSINQPYGNFDFNSIMLYRSSAFAIDNSIPVMTRKSNGSTWGSSSTLSSTDISAMVDIYYTPNSVKNVSSGDIIDVGANSKGDYIYIKKNRWRYELYKNGIKINTNVSSSDSGIDITNSGVILTSNAGYKDRFYNQVLDISEGNNNIFCLSRAGRFSRTSLYKKNGNSWTKIVDNNTYKRLTVDNNGWAWVLADNKIMVFNTNGTIINTINITPYVTSTWDIFYDIGNSGNEIYVSVKNKRNNSSKLLKYSSTINQFIEQPDPSPNTSFNNLDGSSDGTLWYTK